MGDGRVPDLSKLGNGNEKFEIQKVLLNMEVEEDDACPFDGVDSPKKFEDFQCGISLIVDVFGPLGSPVEDDVSNCLGECVSKVSSFNEENVCETSGLLLPHNGESSSEQVSEVQDYMLNENKNDIVACKEKGRNELNGEAVSQEFSFYVGDFVWAKSKSHTWWPGIICQSLEESRDAADQRDRLLVKYFTSSGTLVWSSPSRLKPFLDYFEQMSRQSNSNSFLGAVKKAVDEIGKCVKMEMTCFCFRKEDRTTLPAQLAAGTKGIDLASKVKMGKLGESSVSEFESVKFLASIKYFAQDVCLPSMLKFTVIRNHLSAFYRAIGHQQVPLHQLRPGTNAQYSARDGERSGVFLVSALEKDEEPTKHSRENKTGDLKTVSLAEVDNNRTNGRPGGSGKGSCKKSKKKASKKAITMHDIFVTPDEVNASPAMTLSELRFTALDCLHPDENENFDFVERFFTGFRRWAFSNDSNREISNEHMVSQELNNEMHLLPHVPEVEVLMDNRMGTEGAQHLRTKTTSGSTDVSKTIDYAGSTGKDPEEMSRFSSPVVPFGGGGKKEKTVSVGKNTKPTACGKITTTGPVVLDFENMVRLVPDGQTVLKNKRKGRRTLGLAGPTPCLSAMKGDATTSGSMVIDFQRINHLAPEGQSVLKKREAGATLGLPGPTFGLSDTKMGSMVVDFQNMAPVAPGGQSLLKNRDKRGTTGLQATTAGLVDMKGNNTGNSVVVDFQKMGPIATEIQPGLKKRKKAAATIGFFEPTVCLSDMTRNAASGDSVVIDFHKTSPLAPENRSLVKERKEKAGESTACLSDVMRKAASDGSVVIDFHKKNPLAPESQSPVKKRKEKVGKPTAGLSDMTINAASGGTVVIDFHKMSPFAPESQSLLTNRKEKAAETPGKFGEVASLPDLNGNENIGWLLEGSASLIIGQDAARSESEPKRDLRNEGTTSVCYTTNSVAGLPDMNRSSAGIVPTLNNMQVMGPYSLQSRSELFSREGMATTSVCYTTNSVARLPDMNRSSAEIVPLLNNMQVMGHSFQSRSELINREGMGKAASMHLSTELLANHPDGIGNLPEHIPFSNDTLQIGIVSTGFKSEYKKIERNDKASLCQTQTRVTSVIPDLNGNAAKPWPSEKEVTEMNCIPSEGTPQRKRRKRNKSAAGIPVLNINCNKMQTGAGASRTALLSKFSPEHPIPLKETVVSASCGFGPLNQSETKVNDTETYFVPSQGKHLRKRRRNKSAAGILDLNISCDKLPTDAEASRTALLLKFSPELPVPSEEVIASAFCGFGPLNEAETKVLSDGGGAQVVFMKSSDARDAFRSLEKSSPFGTALVNYRLHLSDALGTLGPDGGLPQVEPMVKGSGKHKPPRKPKILSKHNTPAKPSGFKPQPGEAPDLFFVRQNLEMMTSMLEKAGDNLSPEMRAKLEDEIKGLMKKVSRMVGSSSST